MNCTCQCKESHVTSISKEKCSPLAVEFIIIVVNTVNIFHSL